MKVTLLIPRCGPNGAQNIGDEIEVSKNEAKRMIEAGQAEPVRSAAKKTATKKKWFSKAVK